MFDRKLFFYLFFLYHLAAKVRDRMEHISGIYGYRLSECAGTDQRTATRIRFTSLRERLAGKGMYRK
jgi:hypothetical protein